MVSKQAVRNIVLMMALGITAVSAAETVFEQTPVDRGVTAYKQGDYRKARRWLSTEDVANNPKAWYYLGLMYQEGVGGFEVDKARALRLFQQSADQGVPEAMLQIADLYARGAGVPANLAMARIWHERAANSGSVEGMYLCAQDFSSPSSELPPDYDRARKWYEQAASLGHAEAMRSLGDLYRNGQGVDASMVDALMWYRLAVKAGSVQANVGEAFLMKILPADKRAMADKLAQEWEVLVGRAPAPVPTEGASAAPSATGTSTTPAP